MLALSLTSGYAILALSCLEGCRGGWVQAREIAKCCGVPLPYLSKILHAMGEAGLVEAKRGYRGGYQLSQPADHISLFQVVEAVEGGWRRRCLLGLDKCSIERACPTHNFWQREQNEIEHELQRQTLKNVAEFERSHVQHLGTCGCKSDQDTSAKRANQRFESEET